MTTWQIEPLGDWGRPITEPRANAGRFKASWSDTFEMLIREIEYLDPTDAIVVRLDVERGDIRLDGMLRANATVRFPGVVVSFTSRGRGPLTFATDAYERQGYGPLQSWQANLRAVALSLQALRAVDRYGVSTGREQYVGWRAIEAAPSGAGFSSPEEAMRWMRAQAEGDDDGPSEAGRHAYRALARRMHPDAGGDPADWARLAAARNLLEGTNLW